MKKIFTIIGLLTVFASGLCKAQTNLDLELWQTPNPETPTNWNAALNPLTSALGDTSVTKGGGQSGFAAKLCPVDLTLAGLAAGASLLQYGPTGIGDVYTNRADSVTFYYLSNHTNLSTEVNVFLTHYNSVTSQIDTIARSETSYSATVNAGFVLAKKKLVYDIVNGNLSPDSLKINVVTACDVATANQHTAYFAIDQIQLKGTAVNTTGLTTYATASNIKVYPTIVTNNINFEFENSNYRVISIYDITGKEVASEQVENNRHTLSLSDLESGYYVYKISDSNNRSLKTGKFVVSHY